LIQGIAHCAAHFKRVDVHFSPGNHGRNVARHPQRATSGKWDSHETVIYYGVMKACAALSNVRFDLPKTPYVTFDYFGHKAIATHGDTVLRPGNPGKAVRIASLEEQINRINASLPDLNEYKVVLLGHVHTAVAMQLGNGTFLLINPALIPVDPFAVSLGYLESACGQWMFESTPEYPVGDFRLIHVTAEDDRNSDLDQVIKPWPGFLS
jgi:hypothetical protein